MDIAGAIMGINTEIDEKTDYPPVQRTIPNGEVQQEIHRLCAPGMHYPEVFSLIGKLVSGSGISHDALKENSTFIAQYISPESDTFTNKSVDDLIEDHRKKYPHQVGSRLKNTTPTDCFSDQVYNTLPEAIRRICLSIEDARKRDVCLIGIITALSAAFGRYRFFHGSDVDVKEYSPHLLSLVLGAAGSGKGLTRYGVTIVESISRQAIEMRKIALENYKKSKGEFERERKKREKENSSCEDLKEPNKPIKYSFAMSASDTTQAALVEILSENPIGGLAFDSEVDTMVQGNAKKDFGGFSDVIRKVFHHEPLARQRKGEGESYIVHQPRLAVMLSGTHDQLKKLITSEYNGLFSRLWYYSIPATFLEYKIAKQQRDIVGEMCIALQEEVFQRADLWSDELVYLEFTEQQEQELFEAMQDKRHIEEKHGGDVGASWLRMALIIKRIAVTLAGFEGVGSGNVPTNCWAAAMALLPALKSHCLRALDVVRSNQGKIDISKEVYEALKATGMTDKVIAGELCCHERTLRRKKEEWK